VRPPAPTSATEAVIDAIAVHRLTKLLQDDDVWPLPELREAALARLGDSRAADLLTCPFCLGMWIAGLVVVLRVRFPGAWPWIARVLTGSAVAGHLGALEP
jgi:uncharacterized protein DUF1360